MRIVSIYEAKTHFSSLVLAAERGVQVVIARNGHPVAKIAPLDKDDSVVAGAPLPERGFGAARGQFDVPDDFDDPLPQDVLRAFGAL